MNIKELSRLRRLIESIQKWAIDRDLDKKATRDGQIMKTLEEGAELIIGISKGNLALIRDSIGDVFVTLVIGNFITYKNPIDRYVMEELNKKSISCLTPLSLCDYIIRDLKTFSYNKDYKGLDVRVMIRALYYTAYTYDLDLIDCVETAYNEIADRKGVVKNGTFIKESDLV